MSGAAIFADILPTWIVGLALSPELVVIPDMLREATAKHDPAQRLRKLHPIIAVASGNSQISLLIKTILLLKKFCQGYTSISVVVLATARSTRSFSHRNRGRW